MRCVLLLSPWVNRSGWRPLRQGSDTESALPPREWEWCELWCWWEGAGMGWDGTGVGKTGIKDDYYAILYWVICIGKLQPIYRPITLSLHPLSTKQTQSIGWEPVASTNCTERYLAGLSHLRLRQQRWKDWMVSFYTQGCLWNGYTPSFASTIEYGVSLVLVLSRIIVIYLFSTLWCCMTL